MYKVDFESYIEKAKDSKDYDGANAICKEMYTEFRKIGNVVLREKAAAGSGTYCASGVYEETEEEKALGAEYQALYDAYKVACDIILSSFKKEKEPRQPRRSGRTVIHATQVYDDDARPTSHILR